MTKSLRGKFLRLHPCDEMIHNCIYFLCPAGEQNISVFRTQWLVQSVIMWFKSGPLFSFWFGAKRGLITSVHQSVLPVAVWGPHSGWSEDLKVTHAEEIDTARKVSCSHIVYSQGQLHPYPLCGLTLDSVTSLFLLWLIPVRLLSPTTQRILVNTGLGPRSM